MGTLFEEFAKQNKQVTATPQPTGSGSLFEQFAGKQQQQTKTPATATENPYDTTSTDRSIANAQMRIENAGGSISQDNRNSFERALNLQEKNNWLFDAFDIISRPQQALYNTVDAALKEDASPLKRGWEGFTGQRRKIGSEFMADAGVTNKYAKGGLGFALDVVADPINFVPLGIIPKAVKLAGKGIGSSVKYGTDLAESVVPALKNVREQYVEPAVDWTKDTVGNIFKYQNKWDETLDGTKDSTMKDLYNQTENNIQYMSENSLRDITKAARDSGGVKSGDDVGRLMEKDLKQFEDVKGYEFPDGVRRTENKSDLLDTMKSHREQIASLGKGVNATGREYKKAIEETASLLAKTDKEIQRLYYRIENRTLKQLANREVRQPVNPNFIAKNKAFSEVSKDPTFNLLLKNKKELSSSLTALRTQSKEAKAAGIAQIGKLVDDTDQLKEAVKNPVMIQKEIPRPVREMSSDPQVKRAADSLMKSNNMIREWARSNDIPVGEIEGYMKHILSAEEKALRNTRQGKLIDAPRGSMNNPDKGVLKSRTLAGSAEDVNERLGKKLFETNAFFSSAIGQRKLIEYGNATKFRKDVLSNPSFARPKQKGVEPKPGQEVINLNNYSFLKNGADDALETIGGEYLVTKGVKAALERYQHLTTDDGIKGLLRLYDTGMSWWKRGTLLSIPYHLRNDIGAKFNSYVAGMNLPDMTIYSALATKDITNALARGIETPMYNEFRQQGLSSSSQMTIDFAKHGDDPEKALTKIVKDQSRNKLQKAGDLINPFKIFNNSQKLGTFVDQTNRYALYRWGRETKKMSPDEAAALVRETQFDYGRITKAEKEIGTRLMPFYRWSRNNIPYQLRKFAENPARYSHVNKLRENANESMGIDDENQSDYLKEGFFMPVTGDGKGTGQMLGMGLPIGDLPKLSSPGQFLLNSAGPYKTLGEIPTNTNFFTGSKIQSFKGEEKKYRIPEDIYGMKIPGGGKEIGSLPVKLAHTINQLGGQPARGFDKIFGKPTVQQQEDNSLRPTLGIGSMFKKYDINETNFFQKKKELRELLDYIDVLEQETGERPKSVNDIKRGR